MKTWWTENFKDHTTLILTGVRRLAQFLSGDAKISGHASGHLPSAGGDTPQDGNIGGNKRAKIEIAQAAKTKNKDLRACGGYNSGSCARKGGEVCPRNDSFFHRCSKCNSIKHTVMECPQMAHKKVKAEPARADAPWAKKNRGKGGGTQGSKY